MGSIILDDAERTRLAAKGFITVREAADMLGYTPEYVRQLCNKGAIHHTRRRTPGATRDSIRVALVHAEELALAITPLANQVVASARRRAS
jgi:hypothetical protein